MIDRRSVWAAGLIMFAAFMMIIVGSFQMISGLAAIFDDQFYVKVGDYLLDVDVTVWGWVHLILGAVVMAAGFALLSGALWARIVGVIAASLSAIANFAFIPYYPVWSITIIAVDAAVIWALIVHGRDLVRE
jgi:hypothetical protein